MVIKYAMGEKDILIARKSKEAAEKKFNDANKDKEGLQYKIKTLSNERTRLQGLCDVRGQETQAARREGDKLREELKQLEAKQLKEVKQLEAKLLAASSKLNAETEAHKETSDSLNRTLAQLAEVQGSVDKVKADCQEVIDQHKKEEMKAKMA